MTISDDEDSGDEKKEKEKDKPTVKVNPDDDSDNDDPTSSLKCDPTGKKYNNYVIYMTWVGNANVNFCPDPVGIGVTILDR